MCQECSTLPLKITVSRTERDCLFPGLTDTYGRLMADEASGRGRETYSSTQTDGLSRAVAGGNHLESTDSLDEDVSALSPEYLITHITRNNTTSRGTKTASSRLPRSALPSGVQDRFPPRSVRHAWHMNLTRVSQLSPAAGESSRRGRHRHAAPSYSAGVDRTRSVWNSAPVTRDSVTRDSVTRDSVTRDSVTRDSVTRDSVIHDSVTHGSVPRDSQFRRRSEANAGLVIARNPYGPAPTSFPFARRRATPDLGTALGHRARRLWSRMSSAVAWLPRMMSQRVRGLQSWMSSSVARWGSPQEAHGQESQHSYQQDQRQDQWRDQQQDKERAQQQHQQQSQRQSQQQSQRQHQQPTSADQTPAVLDRRVACACDQPSRRKFRNVGIGNALGQFLSTSFWIPALGLFYLLGLSR